MTSRPRFDVNLRVFVGGGHATLRLRSEARRVAITGPSGVGKTTALRAIAGAVPCEGTVHVGGRTFQDDGVDSPPPWERRVGYVPQHAGLFPHLSVEENLRFRAREELGDLPRLLRIDHLLSRPVDNLSGGERSRVALARALLTRPRLLLLDEPLAALDRSLRAAVTEVILERCHDDDGPDLILVSHDSADVSALTTHRVKMG